MKKYTYSSTGIENYLSDLFLSAWKLTGNENIARSNVYPIAWYIATDRASAEFVKSMLKHRPSTIAKRCSGGSVDETISRIKKYLKVV